MSYLQKKEIQGDKLEVLNAANANYGDLVCPNCKCTIVTPDYTYVLEGTGRCPFCKRSFRVTKIVALQSNIQQYNLLKNRSN